MYELLFLHGNRQETDLSLGLGKGGDLLFLFCNVNRGPLCKVSSKNLKRIVGEIFKEILQSNNDTTFSYWRGVVGLVHLLEVLDESGLVQLDLNNVLLKFDSQLVRHLVSLESPSDEKLLMLFSIIGLFILVTKQPKIPHKTNEQATSLSHTTPNPVRPRQRIQQSAFQVYQRLGWKHYFLHEPFLRSFLYQV